MKLFPFALCALLSFNPITITETDFFLPKDGAAAQAAILNSCANLGVGDEVYLAAYSYTWPPLLAALEKDAKAGAKIHVLLDRSQSETPSEKKILPAFIAALPGGDVTLTTAGPESTRPSAIWHWKSFIVLKKGTEPLCWEGSLNFTTDGFNEGNSARIFHSKEWAAEFIAEFKTVQTWAAKKN